MLRWVLAPNVILFDPRISSAMAMAMSIYRTLCVLVFLQKSHIFPFFLWQTSLSQKLKVSVFGWDEHAFYETKFRRKLKDIRISAPSSVSPFCVLAIPDKTPTSICYPGTSPTPNLWFRN